MKLKSGGPVPPRKRSGGDEAHAPPPGSATYAKAMVRAIVNFGIFYFGFITDRSIES